MDSRTFDEIVRGFQTTPRRALLAALGGAVLSARLGKDLAAKNNNRKKKLRRNEFGCVNVGNPCRGNDNNCCSGVCEGKKPKKGDKDKSRCVGHDESTCQPGQSIGDCTTGSVAVACQTTAGKTGECVTTTGNAAYCFDEGDCFACERDTDCVDVCGIGAACIKCPGCIATAGTACVGTDECGFLMT